MSGIQDYWDALERIKSNTAINLPEGSKANYDNVALEAERKKGSIKNRESFSELRKAINETAQELANKKPDLKTRLSNERSKKEYYRELYHKAANNELMLIERLAQLENKLNNNGNGDGDGDDNVTPIR
jgi:hypothetical protein